ncbi:MAG: hypothetical protein JWM49_581 [Microbacteriaceae bacterium]|nr:hypothetical protein [Microbacteriaceae bacterium]
MSVVDRNVDTKKEVKLMTSTIVMHRAATALAVRRARPRGLDRVVMRLGVAMFRWARRRADRSALSFEDHALLMQNARQLELRERGYTVIAHRVL